MITLSPISRYAVAVATVAVAVGVRLSFDQVWGTRLPFITMFPAIVLSAWLGGFWPGILATVICAASAQYLWLIPAYPWASADPSDVIGLLLFVTVGAIICALNEAWRRGAAAAERGARLLQTIDDGIFETDRDHRITSWNPAAERMYGYTAAEAIGRKAFELLGPTVSPEQRSAYVKRIEAGEVLRLEVELRRKDGSVVWSDAIAIANKRSDGTLVGYISVHRDITYRKEIERQGAEVLIREQAARADLEHAGRLKDEFLAVLSHELRTPLNAVLGYAHLLAAGKLPSERVAHALAAIQRNARAQARLVESLLDVSRIMAGKLELNLERLDLTAIVDAAVDVIRPDAEEKGITLDVLPPPDPIALVGDPGRLQQVFWNLLSNAIKFTPPGGRIGVSTRVHDGNAEVRVTDSGQGISPDFLPYVFDRFTQADSHNGRRSTGLGLGLALVREMVQGHGGTVSAETFGEGRGSSFTVTLPFSLVPVDTLPRVTATPADASRASLAPLSVLIVDDDGDVRDVLALLLESHGATVRAVASATAALDAIHASRPDVLLADIGMAEENGYSLIRKVRAREHERNATRLPAIAVSAYATLADREQASAAGYDGHVPKPIDPDALALAIAKVATLENV